MGQLGIYVERYTISSSDEMNSLMRLSQVGRRLGHRVDFLFRPDMYKIPEYDAIYIRALTDPLNSAYVASRTAEMHGLLVVDDPDSIRICCDKVSMYRHLMRHGVPIPETEIIDENEISLELGQRLLDRFGDPVVLKAPNSSFSMYVEKASTPREISTIARRFLRRSDRVLAQRFVKSSFDWRVGTLGGEPLYVCQYVIPKNRWKILTYTSDGKAAYGPIRPFRIAEAPALLLQTAVQAANAIGRGLYGVDVKQVADQFIVIEVNDNPTINAGEEDMLEGDLYERLVRHLLAS
ncbi:MAG TPA: RimK family alpha-L-glutamate ligase [Acidobacteriota bacterium]|nr:RimK family alpha-L-glutamate ligase [Acidobacteriota bacterium]